MTKRDLCSVGEPLTSPVQKYRLAEQDVTDEAARATPGTQKPVPSIELDPKSIGNSTPQSNGGFCTGPMGVERP